MIKNEIECTVEAGSIRVGKGLKIFKESGSIRFEGRYNDMYLKVR